MEFVRVAGAAEVPAGQMKLVTVKGQAILLANVGGQFYAIGNTCPHSGGSLAAGTLAGSTVTCPRHHAQFDVTSGAPVANAKILFLKMKTGHAARYEVKVSGGDVLVGVGA